MQKIHLIAIGGSAMHNLALALHEKGYKVTGSDDEINEPSYSRLKAAGILPKETGWFTGRISAELDAVILGMHARADNPELLRARELGVKVYSYPEFIYEATKDKTRVVIGGSHGKTTITSMVLHVMKHAGIDTDFLVGAQLEGFTNMVGLRNDTKYAVIEGDEYLASPIDRRPKFHLYLPQVAVLSGIAWDHINVFPTFDIYVEQFREFIRLIRPGGTLVYCGNDRTLQQLCDERPNPEITYVRYGVPEHEIIDGVTMLIANGKRYPLQIFGDHNLMNLAAAWNTVRTLGITDETFLESISTFRGAAKRLELVAARDKFTFFKDFAHSPSKLKATTEAVRRQFPERHFVAVMELHTFSSLNENFLNEYAHAMDASDEAIVYFNPRTIAHKQLKPISPEQVQACFARPDLTVRTKSADIVADLSRRQWQNSVLLMMSSGNFDGVDFSELGSQLQL